MTGAATMKRFVLILMILVVAPEVDAKIGGLSDAPAIRQQTLMRKSRHELTPAVGVSLGKDYVTSLLFQGGYQYHFTDWISAGLEIGYGGVGFKTPLTKNIEQEGLRTEDPTTYRVARSNLGLMFLAKGSIVPLAGKLVLGGKHLGYVDFHINFGVGLALVEYKDWENPPGSMTVAVLVGAGVRYFPIKLLSINFEVNDYMVPRAEVATKKSSMSQNPMFVLGLSFFLPEPARGL
jgi:outer membrane beta-barrel protein